MRNEFKHKGQNWRACSEKNKKHTGTNALSKQKAHNNQNDNKHNDNKMPLIIITFYYSWMYPRQIMTDVCFTQFFFFC